MVRPERSLKQRNAVMRSRGIVLIVDDDLNTQAFFVTILDTAGFRCVAAASAEEALHRAAEIHFDAVVMDLRLPRPEHGLALARRLRTMPNAPPLVALPRADIDGDKGLFAAQ